MQFLLCHIKTLITLTGERRDTITNKLTATDSLPANFFYWLYAVIIEKPGTAVVGASPGRKNLGREAAGSC